MSMKYQNEQDIARITSCPRPQRSFNLTLPLLLVLEGATILRWQTS